VGAVPAAGFVNDSVLELHDYDELRSEKSALMQVVRVQRPVVVLGSSQSLDILDAERIGDTPVRRRRGGGGLVLLAPGDLWVDWWIPASDKRWSDDVHTASNLAGAWWETALAPLVDGVTTVHRGALDGDPAYRLVCFAGAGPGEVFVNGRKAVGVTQWRVREGMFLSSALLAHDSDAIPSFLREAPDGIAVELQHHTMATLGITETSELVESLRAVSSPMTYRLVTLTV
jgi:lipoate-protein ligase A